MKKSLLLLASLVLVSAFSPTLAQEGPPKVLYVIKEDIKPGMMGAHGRHSASFANIFRSLATPNYRIAMVPVAGNENEVVYITGCESFAELEGTLNATEKKLAGVSGPTKTELERLEKEAPALHAGMRDMFALFRPDLSYNPGVDVRVMRFFSITTIRVRPGHESQFADYIQKLISAARKAQIDNYHTATFQVTSGGQAGTYMVFRPMKSLSELDVPIGAKVMASMSDDGRKDAEKAAGEAVMSSETSTYWFAPQMSYVEKEFAAGDPGFWNPPPAKAVSKPQPKR